MEKEKKKQIAKISVFVASIFLILFSVTYAFINQTLTGTKRQVITSGNLSLQLLEDENNLTITNAMPMYDEVGLIQEAFTFRLINNTTVDTNYEVQLIEISTGEGTNKLSREIVKYGLTKNEEKKIAYLSEIENNIIDSGVIGGNQTIEYALRLWIDSAVTDLTMTNEKSLKFRMDIKASQGPTNTGAKSIVFDTATQNLGESCKTYDDGVDTFLVGQCQNNYVWYSGKLWRVVLKNNETGAIKMITDNSITTIPYNSSSTVFENSYVDQWLNQEFLPTLHDYQDYLVTDSVWDATLDNLDIPTRPNGETTVHRAVGLLNTYEYYNTYAAIEDLATNATGYLKNGVYWYLITPTTTQISSTVTRSYIKSVNSGGSFQDATPSNGYTIRPSINLKSNIQILSGTGTQVDPYRLDGDVQETTNGTTLLNTRYSEEYIRFNNELYRIMNIENNLTKIVAINTPSSFAGVQFHSTSDSITFANASIKTNLNNYYNNLSSDVKNMIQPNTTWYLGTVRDTSNYKTSICSSVDANISTLTCDKTTATTTANIGLPRIGEMFVSGIKNGPSSFWTLTPGKDSSSYVQFIGGITGGMGLDSSTSQYDVIPSIYLKSTVKIANTNTGDGTYEHPYTIELGA